MSLTLRTARCEFSLAIAKLILFAMSQGYEIALAEGMDRKTHRDPTTDHMIGSLHEIGLAQDLDLYKDGVYLMTTEDHATLGAWWLDYGKACGLPLAWGGNFEKKDGNHYSLAWQGRK